MDIKFINLFSQKNLKFSIVNVQSFLRNPICEKSTLHQSVIYWSRDLSTVQHFMEYQKMPKLVPVVLRCLFLVTLSFVTGHYRDQYTNLRFIIKNVTPIPKTFIYVPRNQMMGGREREEPSSCFWISGIPCQNVDVG